MPLPESPAPQAFRDFEHERWESAARVYQDEFTRLTSQAIPALLDSAGVRAGTRLLDVASGPGHLAAAAAERGAQASGADFSAEMVTLAKELHPGLSFRTADAEALPFGDGQFDAVTMGFLLGHLGRPLVAVREGHRVLAPGGRLALSWWMPPERAIAFGAMVGSIQTHGKLDVGLPPAPPFELFGQPDMLRQLLSDAGFTRVEVRPVEMIWRIASAERVFDAYLNGTARTAGVLRLQTPEALAAIRAELARRLEPWRRGDPLELPMPAHVASGVKA